VPWSGSFDGTRQARSTCLPWWCDASVAITSSAGEGSGAVTGPGGGLDMNRYAGGGTSAMLGTPSRSGSSSTERISSRSSGVMPTFSMAKPSSIADSAITSSPT
jgi:hypothetical protein